MALTTTLVQSTAFGQRWLLENAAPLQGTGTITTAGLTQNAKGPWKKIANAGTTGIGTVAAGAMTQAQARNLLMSDETASIGNEKVPRAHITITQRSGTDVWAVDANVDGSGNPIIDLFSSVVAPSSVYLDIRVQHSIDR